VPVGYTSNLGGWAVRQIGWSRDGVHARMLIRGDDWSCSLLVLNASSLTLWVREIDPSAGCHSTEVPAQIDG
jgi:hypothetical protein